MMDVKGATYNVSYDPKTMVVTVCGVLRLQEDGEDAPITRLLNEVVKQAPATITLDLRSLELMNSTGVGVLIKFMKKVRARSANQVVILGNNDFFWQRDILAALKSLSPRSELHWYSRGVKKTSLS